MNFMGIFLRKEFLRKTYSQNQPTMVPIHPPGMAMSLDISPARIRLQKLRQDHLK